MRRRRAVSADDYGGFDHAPFDLIDVAHGSASDAADGYDMSVPQEEVRNVTPPRMRAGGAREPLLRAAFEGAFAGAAPTPVVSMVVDDEDGLEASQELGACPVFTALHAESGGGARRRIVLDERGEAIQWPWEGRREGRGPSGPTLLAQRH